MKASVKAMPNQKYYAPQMKRKYIFFYSFLSLHLSLQQSAGHSGIDGQSSLEQTVVIAAFFAATEFLEDVNASNKTDIATTVETMMFVNLFFILIVFTVSNLSKKNKPCNGAQLV